MLINFEFDIVVIEDMFKYMQNNKKTMKNNKLKIALALGSGGAKGFAHIGVLKAFEDAGIKFDIITGSSMGAIVGACYALGISCKELQERALKLSTSDILDLKFPNSYGFIKGNKAENAIRELLGVKDKEPKFSDCKIPFGCVAADIAKGELVSMVNGDIIPSVRASFSICGVFRPVEINGRKLLDGGIFCRVPVDLAYKMGADIVVAVDCIGETRPENMENFKYSDTIARIFNLMDYKISKPEMDRADILMSLYQPSVSSIRIKNIADGIEVGYQTANKYVGKIKNLIKSKEEGGF